LGLARWWHDHRAVYRLKDGQWVPAPRRIERAWAWLMYRSPAKRPAPRIFWILWIAVIVANDAWGPKIGWWLFLHPQVAAGIRTGFLVMCAVAATGLLCVADGMLLGCWRRARITRESRDASRLPPPK
jgi:hypothetical protein